MGRKRTNNPLNLPDRTYWKHGRFWYVHRTGKWEDLGTDVAEARRRGEHLNDPRNTFGTVEYWLDEFHTACKARLDMEGKNGLAQRTVDDYAGYTEKLKAFFGKMQPAEVLPMHVGDYLDFGLKLDRATQANREKACLSAFFTWMMRKGHAGVKFNPCIGVRRNSETKRALYVEDAQYTAARAKAADNMKAYAGLVYRTLARPADVLKWTRANIREKLTAAGTTIRVLRFMPSKTERHRSEVPMEIEITPEIDAELALVKRDVIGLPLIHKSRRSKEKKGKEGAKTPWHPLAYTEDGAASMWRRYCVDAGVPTFGIMDLRGKGATDMYQSGVPLEQISALMGHESVTTTERYIKRRLRFVAKPNQVKVPA